MNTHSPYRFFSLALIGVLALAAGTAYAATTLDSGTWTKKSFSVKGTWSLVQDGDTVTVQLDRKFKTKKAPDLKLFLSPKPLNELNGKNATAGSLRIAELKSHKGAQSYTLPAGTDLADYETIIIHCEQYSKLWSGASLK
ncbi:MAG: DM13 domain-containing protein [Planctomycetota bacterium]